MDITGRSCFCALALAGLLIGGCAVAAPRGTPPRPASPPPAAAFDMEQTLSDGAQRTTLAFAGLAMLTGTLESQTFFPPGKLADYTGFQYLRDNDPDGMGHNTSFLTRVACDVISVLSDEQLAQLAALASAQQAQTEEYALRRFPLMRAFRRLLEGDLPAGATGLDLDAVRQASRELYVIDGRIAFDRALLYAEILGSLDGRQRGCFDSMVGVGWASWPEVTEDDIRDRLATLPRDSKVAVMTYAGDLFSWYAGSVEADTYFCPERHGTYFGSFYMKDAPAVGHEGYAIDTELTATAGTALCDAAEGYVTPEQAALVSSLVQTQREALLAIVEVRTEIATILRSLLVAGTSPLAVEARVLELSALYGELDGENNHAYATVFAQLSGSLTAQQHAGLAALRRSIMSGAYADGTSYDFSVCTTPYLYAAHVADLSVLAPYLADTDRLFDAP